MTAGPLARLYRARSDGGCAPAQPPCAISPTGAPNCIKVEMPAGRRRHGHGAGRANGPDFQNLHRNKRSIHAQPQRAGRQGPSS